MTDFVKMDVFFVVTTIVTLVVGALLALAIYRSLRVLKDVEEIVKMARGEAENIKQDVGEIRAQVRDSVGGVTQMLKLLMPKKRARSSKKPEDVTN